MKRKGEGKARKILKDISAMIQGMDIDPYNSIGLVTESSEFPSLDLKQIDAASFYHKILLLA